MDESMSDMSKKELSHDAASSASIDWDQQQDRLAQVVEDLLRRADTAGATAAEAAATANGGLAATVRMGEVETLEHHRDRSVSVTVYFGQRKGSASTADLSTSSLESTLDMACDIARYTTEDEYAGLADADRMATEFPDLDTWHPWEVTAERAIDIAMECESAARDRDERVNNSEGATVSSHSGVAVYGNSHGFLGRNRGSRHSTVCVVLAGENDGMQRDYWYTLARSADDLEGARAVGEKAADRVVRRLDARRLKTCQAPVVFSAEVARGLVSHFVDGIRGGNLYRKASFLVDSLEKKIFPDFMSIREQPHRRRGLASTNYDAEGVGTRERTVIADGVLKGYVLNSYSARKLGMETTGNAGGVHNLTVIPGKRGLDEILRDMGEGLLVTEVMGQGVNILTGDYSRGASGFWIENGEIAFPVQEITVAGNLGGIFSGIQATGSDVDTRGNIQTGSVLVDRMTIAGE